MLIQNINKFCFGIRLCITLILLVFIFPLIIHATTIQDLKKQVVKVGKLDFIKAITIRYYDRNQIKKHIHTSIEQDYSSELSEKEGVYFYLMGFIDRRINVKAFRKKIILDNAGGLYDEKNKLLLALNEYKTITYMNSMILIHELRHAIQDAHFNLSKLMGNYSDFDDRRLAVLSAIEGDATFIWLIINNFDSKVMTSSLNSDALLSLSPIGDTTQIYKLPDILRHQLVGPYIQGVKFTAGIFKKKKWKGVNKILAAPPESSEQILHPEKYLNGEKPVTVNLNYKPEGFEDYFSGVIGEYYLNVLLKSDSNNFDMAPGWGGDKFKIYRKQSNYFLIWKSIWDSEKYCSRFYYDFKRFIQNKFQVDFKNGNIKGNLFIAGNSTFGYFFIKKIDNRIVFVRSNDKQEMNKYIFGGIYD